MNSIFGKFMESWILQFSCKVTLSKVTLQEARSIHDSMNISKIEFITYIYISYYHNLAGFPDILN